MDQCELPVQAFRPEQLPRRGEYTAWILAIITLVGVVILRTRTPVVSLGVYLFLGFFLFAAFSISLGNWMDRQTEIRIDDLGIRYQNGLRRSRLTWDQIEKVSVAPSRMGDKVHVTGVGSHFHFRMLGKINYQGKTRGRVGFADGEDILQVILERSNLQPSDSDSLTRYYARH